MTAKLARQPLADRRNMALSAPAEEPEILVYNYDQVDPDYRQTVIDAAVDIKRNDRKVRDSLITIGNRLQQVKELLPHKQFGAWIHKEFDMSHRMAQNYMNVYRVYGNKQGETVSFLTDTLLIMLAAPGTPEEARAELETEARTTGKSPTKARANAVIRKAKQAADEAVADAWDATPRADIVFEQEPAPEPRPEGSRPTDRNAIRRARLQAMIDQYRETIATFSEYGDTTGAHTDTLMPRRGLERMITRLKRNLEALDR